MCGQSLEAPAAKDTRRSQHLYMIRLFPSFAAVLSLASRHDVSSLLGASLARFYAQAGASLALPPSPSSTAAAHAICRGSPAAAACVLCRRLPSRHTTPSLSHPIACCRASVQRGVRASARSSAARFCSHARLVWPHLTIHGILFTPHTRLSLPSFTPSRHPLPFLLACASLAAIRMSQAPNPHKCSSKFPTRRERESGRSV